MRGLWFLFVKPVLLTTDKCCLCVTYTILKIWKQKADETTYTGQYFIMSYYSIPCKLIFAENITDEHIYQAA